MDAKFSPGNQLTLLNSGREYFPALLTAIAEAKTEIYLESYIFAKDLIGHEIASALCLAAQRGVIVNVTVDGFGARNFATDFQTQLASAGVRTLLYRPDISPYRLRRHRLRRLHRKLVVIDGQVAFVGGINIVDDDNAPTDMRPRYDYAVRVEGPVLADIHQATRHMWEVVTWVNFKRRFRFSPLVHPCCREVGDQRAAFLIRDNIRHRNDILHAYLDAIDAAREEILIANAYFLPGLRFARALYAAAHRGVKITILLQGKTDHPLMRYATQALYASGLKVGIRFFEYEKSFLHAKVAIVDGEWATVGSSNIDPFSLLLAKEANLVVRDKVFAGELRASIHDAMRDGSREMLHEELSRQAWHSRFLRWFSYSIVRFLLGLAGYRERHWQPEERVRPTKPEDSPPP